MDLGILAARRQIATERLAKAAKTIGKAQGVDLTFAPAPANDPAIKLLYQLEAAAELLETVAKGLAPDTIDVSPTALELATEQGVDLAKVEGTGVDGRILKSDVLEAVDVQAAEREEAERLQTIADAEANTTAAALKYAHENGVDLTTVTGKGTGGRITLEDVKGANGEA